MLLRMQSNSQPEEQLHAVLERARTAGFLGPGPLRVHSEHARAFAGPIPHQAQRLLDLGSGGGVPGLPLFVRHSQLGGVLLDSSEKRCAFLTWAVAELDLQDRVAVRRGRAEELGHESDLRGQFDVVTCRGFGPPAATVEGAIAFLNDGGVLVISEPPEGRTWSSRQLEAIGLQQFEAEATVSSASGETQQASRSHDALIVAFRRVAPTPSQLPRPIKKQRAKPLVVLEEG